MHFVKTGLLAAAALLLAACGDSDLSGAASAGSGGLGGASSGAATSSGGGGGTGGGSSGGADAGWFAAWGTAIYTSFPNGPLTQMGVSPTTGTFTGNEAVAQSFRVMIHPGTGGRRVRLHFSNAFGTKPLVLQSVSIAQRAAATGPAIVAGTSKALAFGGQPQVSIPAGAEATSDPVDFVYAGDSDLAVSFHAPGPTGPMSWHAEAFATQYASLPNSGDVTADATGAQFGNVGRGWFFLSGLDAQADPATLPAGNAPVPAIVFFGDSITDGFGSAIEGNGRYPDLVARRLSAAGIVAGVVNTGINSNTVTPARDPVTTGPPGLQRFARDALGRAGLKAVFILEGTNDLSAGKPAQVVYDGLVALARQAQAKGACAVVSTVLPRDDPPLPFGWDAATEEPQRQALNQMILASTAFDAVVDLGKAMENPLLANQPLQAYFVEGLHPNPVGYSVMANAIPLTALLPAPLGDCRR